MHQYVKLTKYQKNALIGSMLGDGCLYKQKQCINPSFIIHRAAKDRDYLEFEIGIFKEFSAKKYVNGPKYIELYSKFHKKIQKKCEWATIATPTFLKYYNEWYPNGSKIIPNNLELNGQIIAHWICDDGWVGKNKVDYRFQFDISTDGFTKDEVHFLAELMSKRYNENIFAQKWTRKETGKDYYKLRAYDSACRAIIGDMDQFFKMDRKRMWDDPISRYYINVPERQMESKGIIADRKRQIASFISDRVEMTYKDLSHKLGYEGRYGPMLHLNPYKKSGVIYTVFSKKNNVPLTIKFR